MSETADNEYQDSAERLIALIGKIIAKANDINNSATGNWLATNFFNAIPTLSIELEFENDAELREHYIGLCNKVKSDVLSIRLPKETVRDRYIEAISSAVSFWDAKNYGSAIKDVFSSSFTQVTLDRLDDISSSLQDKEILECTYDEISDAFSIMSDAIDAYLKSDKIPDRVARLLKHYLNQMEDSYNKYTDFGDSVFWKIYKETFSTFVEIHPIIIGSENEKEIIGKFRNVMGKLQKYGLKTLSIVSDGSGSMEAVQKLLESK